jgi:hypothetical protein
MSLAALTVPDDAPCVAVYSRLRAGVPGDSSQIGYGYNLYSACPAVTDYLRLATEVCVHQGRLAEYGTAHDARDRALAATLLGRYLDVPVEPDQVVFTNGATEGIAITMGFLAQCGAGVWLPLPCYYAFEQNLAHRGGQILGHYRDGGHHHRTGLSTERTGVVQIVPNGVTGGILTPPFPDADFRVVDIVFQASNDSSSTVAAAARRAVGTGLRDTAVLMTLAKDLCLPGIRAGLLASGSPALLAAARRKHFTDLATINPVLGPMMLLYLTALLLTDADREPGGVTACYQWIRAEYDRSNIEPVPTLDTCRAIVDHWAGMGRHNTAARTILAEQSEGLLDLPDQVPVAGYSMLARLRLELPTADDLVAWVNTTGRWHALKLNPHLLFGGTPETWQALYPGQSHIRINLSVPHHSLVATLSTLRLAAADLDVTAPAGIS